MRSDELHNLRKEILEIRDRHPHISPDNLFVAWFLRAFIVDNEELAIEALKGGSRDKGVDAVYIDHDAQIVFVLQGKYRVSENAKPEKRSDIIALADLGHDLLGEDRRGFSELMKNVDPTVKAILEQAYMVIHKRNYQIRLQFVTTGKVSDNLREESTNRFDYMNNASFQVFSQADLVRLMQDYVEGASPPVPTISLPIYGEQLFSRFDQRTGITSWVFTILGQELGKLYKHIGDRLFARNIRGFLGNTDINEGMLYTLKHESEYFWYFNNGVTIICDEAKEITERGQKNIRVKNGQIINGQQTTRILAKHSNGDDTVLVKIIVVPRESKDAQAQYSRLVSQIVSATNWQNAISQSDLKSNDIEQVRIDRDLRKLDYQYLRKRQTKSEARRVAGNRYRYLIKKEDLAQRVGACLLDPYEIRLGKNRLFEDDVYPIIFNGRPAAEYLVFYWLGNLVSYFCRGDIRKGYAKWIVLNRIWKQIGNSLTKANTRENFRYVYERDYKFSNELRPINYAVTSLFKEVLLFYRASQKAKENIVDESTFFKHKDLHQQFERFLNSSRKKNYSKIKKQLRLFIKRLRNVER